jgi:hypothetical protein
VGKTLLNNTKIQMHEFQNPKFKILALEDVEFKMLHLTLGYQMLILG